MEPAPAEPWIRRHWKWLIAAGCLGLTTVAVWFVGLLVFAVMGGIKSSGIYQDALAAARSSPAALDALGEPIEPDWWVIGSIHTSGPSGEADLAIPVSGPSGAGKLYVIGEKRAGKWEMELLELELEGGERIDLLPASPSPSTSRSDQDALTG